MSQKERGNCGLVDYRLENLSLAVRGFVTVGAQMRTLFEVNPEFHITERV